MNEIDQYRMNCCRTMPSPYTTYGYDKYALPAKTSTSNRFLGRCIETFRLPPT